MNWQRFFLVVGAPIPLPPVEHSIYLLLLHFLFLLVLSHIYNVFVQSIPEASSRFFDQDRSHTIILEMGVEEEREDELLTPVAIWEHFFLLLFLLTSISSSAVANQVWKGITSAGGILLD